MSPANDSPDPERSEVDSLAYTASPARLAFRIDASVYWRIVILGILTGLLFRHELYRLTYIWSNNGTWSHGWLVPVFSIYFLYTYVNVCSPPPFVPTGWDSSSCSAPCWCTPPPFGPCK